MKINGKELRKKEDGESEDKGEERKEKRKEKCRENERREGQKEEDKKMVRNKRIIKEPEKKMMMTITEGGKEKEQKRKR